MLTQVVDAHRWPFGAVKNGVELAPHVPLIEGRADGALMLAPAVTGCVG
jgi:hypothetical protein